jgi:fibronectin type 3 domain-containing protein
VKVIVAMARRLRLAAVPMLLIVLFLASATASSGASAAASLSFSTSAQTLTAGTLSGPITVKLGGTSGPVAVALSSTSSGGTFFDATGSTTVTSVSIPSGQTSVTFLYKDTVAGTPTITAKATALNKQFKGTLSKTQKETILAPPPSPCKTSGPSGGSYTITVCLTPSSGSVKGTTAVTASISISGTDPHTAKVVFYIDGQYLLTDFETPYTFTLPSANWIDGSHTLEAEAIERDGFVAAHASVALTFANGVTKLPTQPTGFKPTAGTKPAAGQPYVLAAVGDGAAGQTSAAAVSDLIASWNPNAFLYLGDVYEKGTATEFMNWYGTAGGSLYFGRFSQITDPTVGNHEYTAGQAPGYFGYWKTPKDYYSVNTPAGWHLVSLNSNLDGSVGSAQYNWLSTDLKNNTQPCTLVYFHHPLFNIGVEPVPARFTAIWPLLAQKGVDIVLTGHDHDYQRWVPMDGSGTPNPAGPTEFVVGTGGHSLQSFVATDSRVANSDSGHFGALRLDLSSGGASYRYVTTAGTTLDSGAVACNPTASDTTPPSVPTNLTATTVAQTNISPGIVNLSWNPSTDNVGVTGYAIYRDGNQVGTVGTQTTYADQTVKPQTTYSYQVLAMDAKGNQSALSTPALGVTTPPIGPIFSDGFESGDLSSWDTSSGLQAVPGDASGGTYAAEGKAPTGTEAAYAWKALPAPLAGIAYSIHFKIISKSGQSLYLERFRTGPTATSLLGVYVSNTGRLGIRNDASGGTSTTSTAIPPVSLGNWHTLLVQVSIAGASGQVGVWLDGSAVPDLTGTQNLGTSPVDRIQLGDKDNSSSSSTTYDVLYDDVVVDTASADNQAPSVPANLSATTVAQTQSTPGSVNLSWDASTDNVGVTGYAIYRDGNQVGTVGTQTTYADQTVLPETTYSYQVLATDAYGNQSALSTPALGVTTPPATSPPTGPLFSDGFESGDLSQWSSTTVAGTGTLTTQANDVYTGSYAAEATAVTTSDAASASKTLTATQMSLYYRIRFKIISQSLGNLYLERFRTAGNGALLGVFVSSTSKLGFRNDVAKSSTTSTTAVSSGWHTLQVYLSIADGQVETWLDGTSVSSLTGQDFGTTAIGRIQLGDSSTGTTYDVLFDDVAADTASIP